MRLRRMRLCFSLFEKQLVQAGPWSFTVLIVKDIFHRQASKLKRQLRMKQCVFFFGNTAKIWKRTWSR